MRRRWQWWRRAFLGAYMLTIAGCACGITGKVPYRLAVRIISGNPAYGSSGTWADSWMHYTNSYLAHQHSKYRVTGARCVYHAGVYICSYRVTGYRKPHCMTALIDPTGLAVADPKGNPYVHQVPCSEVMPDVGTRA